MNAKADLAYTVSLEVLPTIVIADHSGIELTKEVAEVSDAELDQAIERMAKQNRQFSAKQEGPSRKGPSRKGPRRKGPRRKRATG